MRERMVSFAVNGTPYRLSVEPRRTLVDVLREDLGLTGTHVGCEHGVCGACTILMDGRTVRACLLLAVQAEGAELTTVEGLARGDELHPLQETFGDEHALQCGFCTPGFLMSAYELLQRTPEPHEGQIREALAGNLCRCTGYVNIIRAVTRAAEAMRAATRAAR
jgi:carbon-monoxide dehydrogenase small subunit